MTVSEQIERNREILKDTLKEIERLEKSEQESLGLEIANNGRWLLKITPTDRERMEAIDRGLRPVPFALDLYALPYRDADRPLEVLRKLVEQIVAGAAPDGDQNLITAALPILRMLATKHENIQTTRPFIQSGLDARGTPVEA